MSSIYYWKDALPDQWESLPLKTVASYSVSNVDKLTKDDEEPVQLCNYTDVYKNEYITLDLEFMNASATADEIRKFNIEVGDVIITKDSESWDDIAIPALVSETKDDLLCGYHLALIRPDTKRLYPDFLFRCLQSKIIRLQLELAAKGVTRYGLPKDEIGGLLLPIPDISVQKAISDYLDKQTQYIDTLIQAKEDLLKLLAEKKQALITRAVTKGTNPTARMKDSGIDWLGEIPAHWEVKKVKYIVDKIDEKVDEADFVIAVENIESFTGKLINVDAEKSYQGPYTAYKQSDILFNKLRPYLAKVHLAETDGALSGELLVLRSTDNSINQEFLFNRMISADFIREVDRSTEGTKMPRASWEDFIKHIKIAIPPKNEQPKISEYIKTNSKQIEKLANATQKSIDLLKERRAALIAAAVTGEIDVN